MAILVTLNGIQYEIPQTGEIGWGNQLTNYLVALGSGGVLTLDGGDFTLLSDVNFGPNFGLISKYYKSYSDNIATNGVLRLANSDTIEWRNTANTGNLALGLIGDNIAFNGIKLGTINTVTSSDPLVDVTTVLQDVTIGLNPTGVVAGTYTNANIQVDAEGRIILATNGTINSLDFWTALNPIPADQYDTAKYTISANTTIISPTGVSILPSSSTTITYFITQGSLPYTLTWFSGITWKDGIVPTLSPTSGATDIFVLTTFNFGTTWIGTPIQHYV